MRLNVLLTLMLISACTDNKQAPLQTSTESSKIFSQPVSVDTTKNPTNIWIDRLTGEKYPLPDSIGGKPIAFYLNSSKVASIAKALYKGQFRPTDNDSTTLLLSYVTTNEKTIRPFYRWCLDFTIAISDGALAEYPGEPALNYAIKFPEEFFNYLDNDPTYRRFARWTAIITYSGLPDYGKDSTFNYNIIVEKMTANCKECPKSMIERIKALAKDVTAGQRKNN
jgi:hypothetical protein